MASNVTAGLVLAARSLAAAIAPELSMPAATQIVAATGATRSRAYELRDAIMDVLPTLVRGPGRPKAPREPAADSTLAELRGEVLRFVMQHPGCVHEQPQRSRYAESFRAFVLELRERHAALPLTDFAVAVLVPLGTLEDWLRPGRGPTPTEAPPSAKATEPDAEPDARQAHVQTLLAQWACWDGDFVSFCDHVREHHRVPLGRSLIANILFVHGERMPKRRAGRSRDEQALRGTFETFFPGAQWVGDGKQLEVIVDGEVIHQNLELCVDAYSGAAVGIDVRDQEDSPAVVATVEHGVHTTGEPPLALLLDNKPCNHTDEVDAALGDTLRLRSTLGRAQNKAHVEGAFGLFSQSVPPIELSTRDPHELARDVARLVANVFFRVLNRRPRLDRDGRSRVDLYAQEVTDEQRRTALASLEERLRKQQLAAQTLAARADPTTRALLDDAFARLRLHDPEHRFRNAIACYPLDDVTDALAIFEGKRTAGTLPDDVDARYLLGIVDNDALQSLDALVGVRSLWRLNVWQNAALVDLGLPNLEQLSGLFSLGGCSDVDPYSFDNPSLTEISGLESLAFVGGVSIEGQTALASIGHLQQIAETGEFGSGGKDFLRNPALPYAEIAMFYETLGVEFYHCGNLNDPEEECQCPAAD